MNTSKGHPLYEQLEATQKGALDVTAWLDWFLGCLLRKLEGESRAEYGKEVLKRLAERLTVEFGSGFSVTNLKLMRQFYLLNAHRISQTASDLLAA